VAVLEDTQDQDEADVISLVDTIMSVGGSSSDDDLSPSRCGLLVSATGTRKRIAEKSPERGGVEGLRRRFPGRLTRSGAGCLVYVPTGKNDGGDCLGRVLNNDGTFTVRMTMNQDFEPGTVAEGELASGAHPASAAFLSQGVITNASIDAVPPSPVMPAMSSSLITSTPDLLLHPPVQTHTEPVVASTPDFSLRARCFPDVSTCSIVVPVVGKPATQEHEPNHIIVIEDEFGRDTCVVNEVCQMIEDMPRPWRAYRAFEAATARLPNIDRAALRLAVLAVFMGQRRCINKINTAGINSVCADDYRNSY